MTATTLSLTRSRKAKRWMATGVYQQSDATPESNSVAEIDAPLEARGGREPGLEGNAQQKGEKNLHARAQHLKLLEELGPIAVQLVGLDSSLS